MKVISVTSNQDILFMHSEFGLQGEIVKIDDVTFCSFLISRGVEASHPNLEDELDSIIDIDKYMDKLERLYPDTYDSLTVKEVSFEASSITIEMMVDLGDYGMEISFLGRDKSVVATGTLKSWKSFMSDCRKGVLIKKYVRTTLNGVSMVNVKTDRHSGLAIDDNVK